MTTATVTPTGEFEDFYQTHFSNTVLLVYSFTADMAAAQDVAQEAFARAWQRWNTVSGYGDPLAWVRRVAINLANSRWRRLRTARKYLDRQRPEHAADVSPDHVMVVAALRRLPKGQREALVLHYLADMPVEDVALHLEAPVGTVKSWLSRGRAALAGALSIEAPQVTTPATREIVARGRARRRTQLATAAACVLAVALALTFFTSFRPVAAPDPLSPTMSPSAALPPGCAPGQVPVDRRLPNAEAEVTINVFNGTGIAGLAEDVAQDLRNRRFRTGLVGNDQGKYADEVAVLRYGPRVVGHAQLMRAYLLGDARSEFDPLRQDDAVDFVVGGQFRQLATPTEMRQSIAALGQPQLPPNTCDMAP
ncbi:SigE family RNA polymerase sigma factor [Catellatospora sp. NPDC049609]|uniref:SigE family RNA polymerase sigma factor n=1 Tax=Catellatospora sp. NPDC049609 TaxID=3155505 RepID=UPI003426E6AF